jgi:2-dehydropantoate 2-reductase
VSGSATQRRRVLIAGCGAIGSVFACLLKEAGHDVTTLGRPEPMRAVAADGLRAVGIWGDHRASGIRAVAAAAELERSYDAVLVTCKSYHTAEILEEIGDRAGPDGLVISLQNGLGNVERIAAVYGASRTLAGRVIFGAELQGPACVEVTVEAEPVLVGSIDGGDDPRARTWAQIFTDAGIAAEPTSTVLGALWGKAFYNAALNPMGALLGLRYGELAADRERARVMDRVISEGFAVARAAGVTLPWASAEQYQRLFHERLVPSTADHRSSMLQDLERGKPTEIDAICGEICRRGDAHGVETPCNRLLWALLAAKSPPPSKPDPVRRP